MLYEEMRLRKTGETVRVYAINPSENIATIFSTSQYTKTNNGWQKIKLSQLVPMDFPINNKDYISKTKKNKAKDRMKLIEATWQTSDGNLWNHSDIDAAVEHELFLMSLEENGNKENKDGNEIVYTASGKIVKIGGQI
jgi:hypothetical protein